MSRSFRIGLHHLALSRVWFRCRCYLACCALNAIVFCVFLCFLFCVPTKTWRGAQFLVLNLCRALRREKITSSHSHKSNQKCSASQWWSNCHGKVPKSCRGGIPQPTSPWSSCTWSPMASDGGVKKTTMCHYMTAPYKNSLLK